ncbi:MAG: class I SAM-dependent methyltransferase [Acidobacteriota bacterium]
MSNTHSNSDWATSRGAHWRDYAAGMEATFAPLDGSLIQVLRMETACRIAEIGCGGGATTLELRRRAPEGSVVHGFDISSDLVEAAKARIPLADKSIEFKLADAATEPPPSQLYDRLTSRFGVMFFDDPMAAFSNLRRWLSPDGRFTFAVWGPPTDNPWMSTVREAAVGIVDLPEAEDDQPGPFRYAQAERFVALLEAAGFRDVETTPWREKLATGGGLPAAEAADFALDSFSIGELITAAGDEARAAVRRILIEKFSRHLEDGVVRMRAAVNLVSGAPSHRT